MLNISTPELSAAEWSSVKATLSAVVGHGYGKPPSQGSVRRRVGRIVDALIGADSRLQELPAQFHAVRDFLSESSRTRRLAEDHIPTLSAQGYSRAQIEALALLGV